MNDQKYRSHNVMKDQKYRSHNVMNDQKSIPVPFVQSSQTWFRQRFYLLAGAGHNSLFM